jgi:hypothetical protein
VLGAECNAGIFDDIVSPLPQPSPSVFTIYDIFGKLAYRLIWEMVCMQAFIYCRVSSEEQASNNHYSLDNQEQKAREYLRYKGWRVSEIRKWGVNFPLYAYFLCCSAEISFECNHLPLSRPIVTIITSASYVDRCSLTNLSFK